MELRREPKTLESIGQVSTSGGGHISLVGTCRGDTATEGEAKDIRKHLKSEQSGEEEGGGHFSPGATGTCRRPLYQR